MTAPLWCLPVIRNYSAVVTATGRWCAGLDFLLAYTAEYVAHLGPGATRAEPYIERAERDGLSVFVNMRRKSDGAITWDRHSHISDENLFTWTIDRRCPK